MRVCMHACLHVCEYHEHTTIVDNVTRIRSIKVEVGIANNADRVTCEDFVCP